MSTVIPRQARTAVHRAVAMGRLTRPSQCQKCGRESEIDAHHPDYNDPLRVEWLCRSCHWEIHRFDTHQRKLQRQRENPDQVGTGQAARILQTSEATVRNLARAGHLPYEQTPLGKLFPQAAVEQLARERDERKAA